MNQADSAPPASAADSRLMSVDALRGFDMLWIVGAGSIVNALERMGANPVTAALANQLKHVEWEGFRFYDLIFPLFLFIVGISLVFSLDKELERGGLAWVLGRVFRRGILLFAVGVFYYGGVSKPWPEVQLGGVLHRIAACYVGAALIYTFVRSPGGLVIVCALLLIGFWALVTFVPIPDLKLSRAVVEEVARKIGSDAPADIAASVGNRVRGSYEEGRNLVNYLDFLYLPGKKAQGYYINEGLLSTLPAIALPLFGVLTGLLFKNGRVESRGKIAWLVAAGLVGLLLGLIWCPSFPLIKRIWSSSFILVAGGCSSLLMALFYWLVDVRGWRRWCQPFVWIGCNALTIYLASAIVGFQSLAARFTGGDVERFLDARVAQGFGGLLTACTGLLLVILFARFLYRRQIFLRL
ncbi:MAG: DUF5009 domain-containing protein [Verrucomicrobia bacterium]|nr:DUF5009 domain-containing protein [Verrucomicrobiota bacterium]